MNIPAILVSILSVSSDKTKDRHAKITDTINMLTWIIIAGVITKGRGLSLKYSLIQKIIGSRAIKLNMEYNIKSMLFI